MFANRNLHDVHQVNKMISNRKRINSVRKSQLLFRFHQFNVILFGLQELNIPVPDAITQNHVNDVESIPAKRARMDDNSKSSAEYLTGPSGTKVLALPTGRVTCNTPICELIKVVKPFIRELVEDSNLLKMWISFMSECASETMNSITIIDAFSCFIVPKIEDGNNFGVAVQEETLGEIQSVESEAAAFFDQISRYFISRAKIVSKVAKYPHLDDYRRAVQVSIRFITLESNSIDLPVFLSFCRNWMKSSSLACGWSCVKCVIDTPHCMISSLKIWRN